MDSTVVKKMSKLLQFENGEFDIEFCGKCGGIATVNNTDITDKDEYLYWVECSECNNRTILTESLNKSIKIWNRKQEELADE